MAREPTKLHEEFVRGTIDELAKSLSERELLGEVTIVIGVREDAGTLEMSDDDLDKLIDAELGPGRRLRDVYRRVIERKR